MKNILLFFLSDIHLNKNAHSFNKSRYKKYKNENREYRNESGNYYECIQTNESAIDYMMDCLDNQLDALYYFSSKKTKQMLEVVENGKPIQKTHVEWFKQRIIEKHPKLEKAFHAVDYDEDADTDESIRQVTEMAERIKKCREEDKDIRIYADMTGGFRHASMMMLSVLQLLKLFEGVTIEKVLYSNWKKIKKEKGEHNQTDVVAEEDKKSSDESDYGVIEEVTELHRMFTLISGADEFVNFGSVTEIEKYFSIKQEKPGPKLTKLLSSMREFSDAIKICRTGKLEGIIAQLQNSINEFSEEKDKNVQEKIFVQIITVLNEEYKELLKQEENKEKDANGRQSDKARDKKRMNIIRWCIRKGFLQQAMTLCAEWLPEVLVNRGICYTDNKLVEKVAANAKKYRNWKQNLIIEKLHFNFDKNKFIELLRRLLINRDNVEDIITEFPNATKFWIEINQEMIKNVGIVSDIKAGRKSFASSANCLPVMNYCANMVWEKRKNTKGDSCYGVNYSCYLNKISSISSFIDEINNLKKQEIEKMVNLDEQEVLGELTMEKIDDGDIKYNWAEKEKLYNKYFENGWIRTDYPKDVKELLYGYYEIHKERNNINHAGTSGEAPDNNYIENMMGRYLDKLDKYWQDA